MFRPSDPISTKLLTEAHIEFLRGRRKPAPRPSPRGN